MKQIITISRQFGSGGKNIAGIVGQKLKLTVYDKEIITRAAEDSGIARELFEKMDEKRSTSFLFSLVSSHYGASNPMDMGNMMTDSNIFVHTADTLRTIAANPCVIVGRCADDILKEFSPLRVFIYADMEDRVKRTAERHNITEKAAQGMIKKMDKSRSSYYNFYTGRTWGDKNNYDLCINTSRISFEKASEIIITAFKE